MPVYTVLTQSAKHRLLRTDADGTTTVVTTIADPDTARALSAALTDATSDLPHNLVSYVLEHTDSWHLCPYEYRESPDRDTREWHELPAPTEPLRLRRRALNEFDHGAPANPPDAAGVSRNELYEVARVRAAVAGQPPSVVRAVRDELAEAFAPYDTVPVLARAYDRKWDEVDRLFLANAGLPLLDEVDLTGLLASPEGVDPALLDAMEAAGLADFGYAEGPAMNGYLDADFNAAQLAAWHRTQLTR